MAPLTAALLLACALREVLPGAPVVGAAERAAFAGARPAPVTYAGEPRVPYPVPPLQVWGLQYAVDVVLVSRHPDWIMHEYARVDLPGGPLWLAKDAGVDGEQALSAALPDIERVIPEVPLPRSFTPLTVEDASTAKRADFRFAYVNPKGQATEVRYRGRWPTAPSRPRNGNTMGHSRRVVAAVLDLHLFRSGGDADVRIDGRRWGIRRLLGLVPMKFLLAQTQGGFAVMSARLTPGDGGFTLERPASPDEAWPTRAEERWTVDGEVLRHDGAVTAHRYHYVAGGLARAEAWQAGIEGPVTVVAFQPAMPDLRRPFAGVAESEFVVDVGGQPGHGRGRASARWVDADTVQVDLVPTAPRWFADRPMRGVLRYRTDGGVDVHVTRVGPSSAPAG